MAHCHCSTCRRAHGAGFVTWAGFPAERFHVVAGAEDRVRWRTETGATRSFCRNCGSTLLYEGPRWEGEVHVAFANFEDTGDLMPQAHAYADRSPAWCPITDDLPRYGGPDGNEPL